MITVGNFTMVYHFTGKRYIPNNNPANRSNSFTIPFLIPADFLFKQKLTLKVFSSNNVKHMTPCAAQAAGVSS